MMRLHYAHPHLHKEVVKRFKTLDKLIPYIDMPTQHGSDKILKDMKRGLNSSYQKELIVLDKLMIKCQLELQ